MSYGQIHRSEMRYKIEKAIRPVRRAWYNMTDYDGDLGRVVAWGLVAICAFAAIVVFIEARMPR